MYEIQLDEQADDGEHAAVEDEDQRGGPGCLARQLVVPRTYLPRPEDGDQPDDGGRELEYDRHPEHGEQARVARPVPPSPQYALIPAYITPTKNAASAIAAPGRGGAVAVEDVAVTRPAWRLALVYYPQADDDEERSVAGSLLRVSAGR
jgi:hypothetical protein